MKDEIDFLLFFNIQYRVFYFPYLRTANNMHHFNYLSDLLTT